MPIKPAGKRNFMFKRVKKKRCKLCTAGRNTVDYKDTDFLRSFITERGKIIPRRVTGNCAKHQRIVTKAVKKSREAGLLPFTLE
jgi:small subunit ribosomal protein S18